MCCGLLSKEDINSPVPQCLRVEGEGLLKEPLFCIRRGGGEVEGASGGGRVGVPPAHPEGDVSGRDDGADAALLDRGARRAPRPPHRQQGAQEPQRRQVSAGLN